MKITYSEWMERAATKYGNKFQYLEDTYIHANKPMTIICPIHGPFQQSIRNHLRTTCGCPKCGYENLGKSKTSNTEEFIEKARKVHGDKYDYSKVNYINNSTKICIICPEHGEFWQTPADHLTGKECKLCGYKKISKSCSLNLKEFVARAKKVHGNKYDYSKSIYNGYNNPITIICPKHGEFEQSVSNHLAGKGCKKCALEYSRKIQAKTTEQFIEDAKLVHNNRYDYSKVNYVNASTPITIICKKHKEFEQLPLVHLRGGGCPKCLYKNQELLYEKLQISFPNIQIIYEADNKIVSWLGLQRFDIYFPEYNIAIEYNGKQHYVPIEHFGGELGLSNTKERDELKRKKCKENNCTLFEVKYNYSEEDYNNLVLEIQKIINSKQK